MSAEVRQFLCGADNFGVLVHDTETGATSDPSFTGGVPNATGGPSALRG